MTDPALPTVRTVAAFREVVAGWRAAGQRVALVPTMGALHEGHLSLVRLAKAHAERVVASVFVNPTQFGPAEDFAAYPRDEAADATLLSHEGCDLLYGPSPAEVYPDGFSTTVTVAGVSEGLCGASRPGHFAGVATVVAKLLIQAAPDVAVFGEKDFQQLTVIRRLVRDLDLPVEVLGAPIARAEDGLALSSRNAYLEPAERVIAGRMNRVLSEAAETLRTGALIAQVERDAFAALVRAGFARVDYLEVRHADDLTRPGEAPTDRPLRILAAAWLGRTRLIDNVAV